MSWTRTEDHAVVVMKLKLERLRKRFCFQLIFSYLFLLGCGKKRKAIVVKYWCCNESCQVLLMLSSDDDLIWLNPLTSLNGLRSSNFSWKHPTWRLPPQLCIFSNVWNKRHRRKTRQDRREFSSLSEICCLKVFCFNMEIKMNPDFYSFKTHIFLSINRISLQEEVFRRVLPELNFMFY